MYWSSSQSLNHLSIWKEPRPPLEFKSGAESLSSLRVPVAPTSLNSVVAAGSAVAAGSTMAGAASGMDCSAGAIAGGAVAVAVAVALSASSCGCGVSEASTSGTGAAEDCCFLGELVRLRLRRRRPPDRLLLVVAPAAAASVLEAWPSSSSAECADNENRCSGQLQGEWYMLKVFFNSWNHSLTGTPTLSATKPTACTDRLFWRIFASQQSAPVAPRVLPSLQSLGRCHPSRTCGGGSTVL